MKQSLLVSAFILASAFFVGAAPTPSTPANMTRIAELEIDAAQLDAYLAALKEEITASLHAEPGVLTLYAVSIKDHPEQIRIFETYASPAAYQSHLETPHFQKYKRATQNMVKSLRLLETTPILLGSQDAIRR